MSRLRWIFGIFLAFASRWHLTNAKDTLPLLNVAKLPNGVDTFPQISTSLDDNNAAESFKDGELFPLGEGAARNDENAPALANVFSLSTAPPETEAANASSASLGDEGVARAINGNVANNNSRHSPAAKPEEDCLPKVDLVFLLDTSGSIEQIYQEHVNWAVALIESLPIEEDTVRVAAVQYAGFPLTEFALGTYPNPEDIRRHLEKINAQSGATRTGYALRKAEAELFREDRGARNDAKKVIVLFTDGLSIDDPLKPAQQLRDLKGVIIYVVSVGADGFALEMNRIAGTRDNVFGPDDMPRLREALIAEAERARACTRVGAVKSNVFEANSPAFRVHPSTSFASSQSSPISPSSFRSSSSSFSLSSTSSSSPFSSSFSSPSSFPSTASSTSSSFSSSSSSSSPSTLSQPSSTSSSPTSTTVQRVDTSNATRQPIILNAVASADPSESPAGLSNTSAQSSSEIEAVTTTSATDAGDEVNDLPEIVPLPDILEDILLINALNESVRTQTTRPEESERSAIIVPTTISDDLDEELSEGNGAANAEELERAAKIAHNNARLLSQTVQPDVAESRDVFETNEANRAYKKEFTHAPPIKSASSTSSSDLAASNDPTGAAFIHPLARVTFEPARAATIIPTLSALLRTRPPSLVVNVASNKGVFTPRISAVSKHNPLKIEKEVASQKKLDLKFTPTSTNRPTTPTASAYNGWRFRQTSTGSLSSAAKSPATSTASRRLSTALPITMTTLGATSRLVTTSRRAARLFASQLNVRAPNASIRVPLLAPSSDCATDFLFIVDSSGSVQKIYDAQKEYLNDVLDEVQLDETLAGHRVALLQFAGNNIQKMEWSYEAYRSHATLMNAFQQVRHITGTTYIGAALQAAVGVLDARRRHVPSVVVLLSDGFSQDDVSVPAEILRRQPNAEIYALSIAELSNTDLLAEIVGRPENVFVGGEGASELRRLLSDRLSCRVNSARRGVN